MCCFHTDCYFVEYLILHKCFVDIMYACKRRKTMAALVGSDMGVIHDSSQQNPIETFTEMMKVVFTLLLIVHHVEFNQLNL